MTTVDYIKRRNITRDEYFVDVVTMQPVANPRSQFSLPSAYTFADGCSASQARSFQLTHMIKADLCVA